MKQNGKAKKDCSYNIALLIFKIEKEIITSMLYVYYH